MSKFLSHAIAGLLLVLLALPAAASSTLGGIVFVDTFYVRKDAANNSGGIASGSAVDADSYAATRIEVPNNTRIRASWSNEDAVGMYIELGLGGGNSGTGVNLRHAYGTYQFTDRWQMLLGHSTSPFSPLSPNQQVASSSAASVSASPNVFNGGNSTVGGGHDSGRGYGEFDAARNPQLRLTYSFPSQRGAIAVALMDATSGGTAISPAAGAAPANTQQRDSKFPRIDIGAAYNLYDVRLFPGVTFQKTTYNNVAAGSDDAVSTWVASFGLQSGKGPFLISAEVNYGQNWRQGSYSLGRSAATLGSGAYTYAGATSIGNTDSLGYWIDLGWRLTIANTQSELHLVYGAMTSEAADPTTAALDFNHQSRMLGLSWPIDMPWVARGFRVRPEVFLYDEGRSTVAGVEYDFGTEVVAGLQFQYTF